MKMKRIVVLATVAVITVGCFQGSKSEIGPRETLETFYRCICDGNFEGAENLCHKEEMNGYLQNIRTAWEKSDITVTAIASDILSEMTVEVTSVQKNGQSRTIFYELVTERRIKEKIATLKKEEGAWKIAQITDRN